jgi:hypothetical protein
MENNLIEKTESLPTPERTDQLYQRANRMIRGYAREPEEDCRDLVAELEELSRPAAKAEIARHLAVMLQSFPNAGNADRQVFVRVLAEDVGASRPSIGVLELACRNLRRSARFMPTINETLEALAEAARERAKIFGQLGNRRHVRQECAADEMLPDKSTIDDRM